MFLTGLLLKKYPPKKVNILYGYRTSSSMKSQERWDFSQKYCALLFIRLAVLAVVLSVLALFLNLAKNVAVISGLSVMIFLFIFAIVKTEKAIKAKFGK
jgi:uncharacterized membrane protein